MKKFNGLTKILAIAAIAGTVGLAGCASSGGSSDGAAAIKERQALMQTILKHWKPIKANAKAGGSAAMVAKHAKALNATSKQMLALPAIWKDWAGFKKANQVFADETAKLASIAASGNQAAIAKQVGATGKNGCGGCHKPFRGAKAK